MTEGKNLLGEPISDSAKVPERGLLVTNHLNLIYMLAAGLVMPPAGFGEKYYSDTLECFPGWIPLFVDRVSKQAVEYSTKEASHLKICIVEFDLAGLVGQAMVLGTNGLREIDLPKPLLGSDQLLLLPAPFPISRVVSIVFQSVDDKRECEAQAKDFNNVQIEYFNRRTNKSVFTKRTSNFAWPPYGNGPIERTVTLQRPIAAGGAMAMLLLFANLGDMAVHACRVGFDPEEGATGIEDDHPFLIGLESWVRGRGQILSAPMDFAGSIDADRSLACLYWEVIDRLAEWEQAGQSSNAESIAIECLSETSSSLPLALETDVIGLCETLTSLTEFCDATVSELFDRHDTSLAHSLILFLLREDCAALLDFESDRLSEWDWLAAAVLFGVRDGWMRLPLRLRPGRDLLDAVSHRMACLSHRIDRTGFDLGNAPPRVLPLRELFKDSSRSKSKLKFAAIKLATLEHWDCIQSSIVLRSGQYELIGRNGSTVIRMSGEPKVSREIDHELFFNLLSGVRFDRIGKLEGIRRELSG